MTGARRRVCLAALLLNVTVSMAYAQPPGAAVPPPLVTEAAAAIRAGDASRAVAAGTRAVVAADAAGRDDERAASYHVLGNALRLAGRYDEALAAQRTASEILVATSDRSGEVAARLEVGENLRLLGRVGEAFDEYTRTVAVAATVSERTLAMAESALATAQAGLGRHADAQASLEHALALYRGTDAPPLAVATVLTRLGIVARTRGRLDDALAFYSEALALARKENLEAFEAQVLSNSANLLRDLGDVEQAIDHYRRALDIYTARKQTPRAANVQRGLAAALRMVGRVDQAHEQADQAVTAYRTLKRPGDVATALVVRALVALELDRREEALADATEAVALARSVDDPQREGDARHVAADAELRSGRPASALAHLDRAVQILASLSVPALELDIRLLRARAYERLGREREAVADLQAGAALVADVGMALRSDRTRVGFFDAQSEVFAALALALERSGDSAGALEAVERGRAQAMAQLMAGRATRVRTGSQRAFDAFKASVAAWDAADDEAGSAMARANVTRDAAALARQDGELADLVTGASPTFADIRAVARGLDATVIEYLVTRDVLAAWVVTPGGAVHHTRVPIGAPAVAAAVTAARRAIDARAADTRTHLRALYDTVLAPVDPWLPRRPEALVVLVPHGPLHLTPFGALVDAQGRPAAAQHTLAVVPSVGVLQSAMAKSRGARAGSALVVTDPRPADPALVRLDGAREEGRRVVDRLGRGRALVLSGRAATETAVKSRAGEARVLHFATHGLVSDSRPGQSALALTPDGTEDGYLRVDEIFGLELTADLVVLSGCSTGLGRVTADGVIGLGRAFVYAGTPRVINSLWDVPDKPTAFLMDRFYGALSRGRSAAAALREAQLATRARYPAEVAWAAFQIVGDPR